MRKILIITFIILVLFLNLGNKSINNNSEVRAIFISYIEISKYINKDYKSSKNNIKKMIKNIKKIKCNSIILQVRSNADAIYHSNIYPMSMYIVDNEGDRYFDVLKYFIKIAHKNNIKVVAWINPYRIRTTEDVSTITDKSPAYEYLNTDIVYIKNGIYFNPSKDETEKLIINGVKEVLEYKIDGLLFDDYFYPDSEIDKSDYLEYSKDNPISLDEYHLNIINKMIKKVYKECKNKNVKFGVSPDGNIENNYNKNFADVKEWLKSEDYVDFIMPQIYYGFYNSTKEYTKVIHEWEELIENENIDYYIALAFYKVGKEDKYAKSGFNEWVENDDIIMREILLSRNLKNYKGFSLFRYDSIFNEDEYTQNSIGEIENMKKVLK